MYLMTNNSVPKGILQSIEKLGRIFLWQKDSNSRGMHYVEWKELCQPMDHGGLGFHGLDNWQGALRARLEWQVISTPNLLLHKVLRGKYGMELWNDTQVYEASTTWKVIHDGAKALRTIIRWNIGDGQSIDVMQDCWILDRRIDDWPTFVNVNELEKVRVNWLLDESARWNEERVTNCFGNVMAERIMSIATNGNEGNDAPELIHSRMSMTLTAMAYKAKMGEGEYSYSWMRKLKLHPREGFFWWRLLRNAIPTNQWLFYRGLSTNSLCPWGCQVDESLDHCTALCNKLKEVLNILRKWGFPMPSVYSLTELMQEIHVNGEINPSLGRIYCYTIYQV
ncbi:Putative ribonuclease H protein [Dendrobium catenatum]|uniref:Ribonuclease H protein n=1 Tax=Dendrobium catenatum TaxID=906689 RepID=A0A2I0VYJ6_9ASPA|nr:Putative ribonuclease H protein [Dendrobium catenatum]